jgi:GNAT superfamily N-acetyltransferase
LTVAALVRVAAAEDLPTVAALRRQWREETEGPIDDPGYEARFAEWVVAEGDRRTYFLVAVDGTDVGMANVLRYDRMPTPGRPGGSWGYVGNVYVRAAHRNDGVGGVLMRAVQDWARAAGYDHLRLAPRTESIVFYERLGYSFGHVMELDP